VALRLQNACKSAVQRTSLTGENENPNWKHGPHERKRTDEYLTVSNLSAYLSVITVTGRGLSDGLNSFASRTLSTQPLLLLHDLKLVAHHSPRSSKLPSKISSSCTIEIQGYSWNISAALVSSSSGIRPGDTAPVGIAFRSQYTGSVEFQRGHRSGLLAIFRRVSKTGIVALQ
jgi:hypothetical protein